MPDGLEDVQTFAQRIKQKFPDYADVDPYELVSRIASKYPDYRSQIKGFDIQGADELKLSPAMTGHYLRLYEQFEKAGVKPFVKKLGGFRTAEDENYLYRTGHPTMGNTGYGDKISPHQEGRAIDFSFSPEQRARGRQIMADYARQYGLHIPGTEPWHIALPRGRDAFGFETEQEPDQPSPKGRGVPLPPTGIPHKGAEMFELTPKEKARLGVDATLPKVRGGVPTMTDVLSEAKTTPYAPSVRSQIANQVEAEMNSLTGTLGMALHPIDELTKSREQVFNEEVDRRVAAYERSQTPEMIAERKYVGQEGAITRALDVPVSKFVAGLGKTAAGITSGFGLAPNRLSQYLTERSQVIEESTDNPLDEANNAIVRGLPEKITSAVVGLGLTVAQLAILKRATGLGLGTIMATETALQTSDMPLKDRAAEVARSYAMGRILDQHLSRPVTAALFGGPTAIQSGLAYAQGRMTLEDALLQTGIQTGAGAIMGGKRGVPEIPTAESRIDAMPNIPDVPVNTISEPRVVRKADREIAVPSLDRNLAVEAGKPNETGVTSPKAQQKAADQFSTVDAPVRVPLKPLITLAVGRESPVSTERGTEVSTKYAIVEAADLVTSHDTLLNKNPDFPPELQPRERDRAASADQINRIAQNVRPEYLGESPKASEGAPIVGPDGLVESGNGRVLGLRKAFAVGKADSYRQYLADNAEAFGLDRAAIERAAEPVLVRIRQTDVDRPQFVREANESGVASMSAPEQARSDAQRLSGSLLSTFAPSESGEINTAANTPFIQAFMRDVVGPNELGRYVSAKGEISQEGLIRIRNAIFARAYGDSPEGLRALEKIAESPDNNVRNVTTALLQRAGQFASLKEGIVKGERYALDPTSDLTKALAKMSSLREQNTTVADYLNQGALFDPDLTPMQRQMLWAFDEFKRSTKNISSILDNYAKGAEAAGSPKQTAFFEKSPPTKEALLEAAIRETVRDANKEIGLFTAERVPAEPATGRSVPNIDQASKPASEGVPRPDRGIETGTPAEANQGGGNVLRSSLAPGVPEFIQQDVLPTAKSFGLGAVETLKGVAKFLSPRSFAPKEGVDILMKMKGNRDKAEFLFQKSMEEVKANFERMPQADLVAFMDRYKRGMPQATPALQAVADSYKVLNDEMYDELKKWKLSLPYLEDHFRVFWKVIPGAPESKGFSGIFRRPLQGTRGMLKQHTLTDVSEGIARGGEPVSYNPQVLQELGYADSMKFITAQRMWQAGKDAELVRFFRNSERGKIPSDYTQIKDPIAKVYFPTEEGALASPGEWRAQEDFARLINNHLSRDYIREAAIGRGAMWLKNQMTMVELGLSAFHAVFETNEAAASALGQGMRRIWNLGVLEGQPKEVLKGISEIVAVPLAPAETARTGGSAIEYLTNKEEFLKTTRGQSFIKQFPEASQMLDDLFTGGGQIGMSDAYRTNTTRAFNEAIANGNYPGALLRALPAFNEQVMKPLFQIYIPRLKTGQFLKEYQLMLQEYKADLESGRLTRPELARKTWDFVEDRYGEMNFDNLFWDRTFKTSAQLLFRSVTWQLGNLRASFGALPEQAAEIGRSVRAGQVPRLTPKMSWFIGQALVTATLGAIITKAFTGNWPEQLSDYVYPRTDKDDPTQRLSIPTYIRVLTGLIKKPSEAIPHAASSEVSRSMEVWRNRDYYGVQVWNPDDPLYKKAPEMLGHFIPVPFSIASFLKSTEQGQPIWKSAASFAGFTKAPAYAYQTPAEERISELLQRKYGSDVKTQRQADRSTLIRDIRIALREKNTERATELIGQGQASGQLTISDLMQITKSSGQSPLVLSFESLAKEVDSYDGLNTMLDVYENYMNDDERKKVRPVLVRKQLALIGLNSVGGGMKPTELRATPAEQQALKLRLDKALGSGVPPPPQ